MSYAQPAIGPRSVVAISLVVLVHAVMLYVLHNGLERSALEFINGPVLAELIDEPQVEPREPPPPPPAMQPVRVESLPEPEIAIDLPSDPGQAITLPTAPPKPVAAAGSASADITPPHIDRARSELTPLYPPTSRRLGEAGRVVLLVHVLANGTIDDVKLEHSSGFERLDQAAIAHVQRSWHFVPARSGSRALDSWGEFALTFRLEQ